MARILSSPWSIIRGSIAGTTYLSNQFHPIIARARTAPVQPMTEFQTNIRSSMAAATNVWDTLTPPVQLGWDLYGSATQWPGPLGTYTVPGRQIFMAGRTLQEYVNLRALCIPTFVTDPPAPMIGFYNLKSVGCVAPTGPGTGVAVAFTTEAAQDGLIFAEVSPPFSTSRKRYKGPWNSSTAQAQVFPANTSGTLEFLGLVDGCVYFVRIKAVADDASPRISPEYIVRCVAQVVGP